MWVPSYLFPDSSRDGSPADVLGCFEDGQCLVVFYDDRAGGWVSAADGMPVSGIKFWHHLPQLPSGIILDDGL